MRIVIQRVSEASVEVDGKIVGKIGQGALVFFAVHKKDEPSQTLWLAQKLLHLRMFPDKEDKLNLSLMDIHGQVLVVSQFTLYGSCLEGRRPDFTEAAPPAIAEPIYEQFVADVKRNLPGAQTGVFGASMKVRLINDGPVTFIIDK
jgi:D-tyrosyl-tRNA(Tyr) deacylase